MILSQVCRKQKKTGIETYQVWVIQKFNIQLPTRNKNSSLSNKTTTDLQKVHPWIPTPTTRSTPSSLAVVVENLRSAARWADPPVAPVLLLIWKMILLFKGMFGWKNLHVLRVNFSKRPIWVYFSWHLMMFQYHSNHDISILLSLFSWLWDYDHCSCQRFFCRWSKRLLHNMCVETSFFHQPPNELKRFQGNFLPIPVWGNLHLTSRRLIHPSWMVWWRPWRLAFVVYDIIS